MLEIIAWFYQGCHPLDMTKLSTSEFFERGGVRCSVFPNSNAFGLIYRDKSAQLVQFVRQRVMPGAIEYVFVTV